MFNRDRRYLDLKLSPNLYAASQVEILQIFSVGQVSCFHQIFMGM